jgi:hypothetical protein
MRGFAPLSTPAFLIHHPKFVVIPNFIGKAWPKAADRMSRGFSVKIGHVPALRAREPRHVLASYVVIGQTPSAGSRVLYAGTKTADGYANPIVLLKIGLSDGNTNG